MLFCGRNNLYYETHKIQGNRQINLVRKLGCIKAPSVLAPKFDQSYIRSICTPQQDTIKLTGLFRVSGGPLQPNFVPISLFFLGIYINAGLMGSDPSVYWLAGTDQSQDRLKCYTLSYSSTSLTIVARAISRSSQTRENVANDRTTTSSSSILSNP